MYRLEARSLGGIPLSGVCSFFYRNFVSVLVLFLAISFSLAAVVLFVL